jgi:RimJ/RimL family protein N-acetyltransferase
MARAALESHESLSKVIAADVPSDWPPRDLADVQELFAARLAEGDHQVGWWGWYIITKPGVVAPSATLVGSCGCTPFYPHRAHSFGYGILPAFEGRGITSEAARTIADWAIEQPGVARIEANTFERHEASKKILARCGFMCLGIAPNDAEAEERDRQGRRRLLLYVRDRSQTKHAADSAGTIPPSHADRQ